MTPLDLLGAIYVAGMWATMWFSFDRLYDPGDWYGNDDGGWAFRWGAASLFWPVYWLHRLYEKARH